jgi:hypothetical protein
MAIIYFVDYPLLLSPFPPYLADATAFSTESLAVSIFGYSSMVKWLYNGGAYPVAFIWNAITSMILATQPIYLSSYYGIFEPIALGLISYIVGRRMISDNIKRCFGIISGANIYRLNLVLSISFQPPGFQDSYTDALRAVITYDC